MICKVCLCNICSIILTEFICTHFVMGFGENKKVCVYDTLMTWPVYCHHVTGSLIYWMAVTLKPYIYTSRNCECCKILGFHGCSVEDLEFVGYSE
jgi:hypothetical protein